MDLMQMKTERAEVDCRVQLDLYGVAQCVAAG